MDVWLESLLLQKIFACWTVFRQKTQNNSIDNIAQILRRETAYPEGTRLEILELGTKWDMIEWARRAGVPEGSHDACNLSKFV